MILDEAPAASSPAAGSKPASPRSSSTSALGAGTSDAIQLLAPAGASNDTIRAGDADASAAESNQVNLNNDDDSDLLTGDSTENFLFSLETPNSAETNSDVFSADGTPGSGQAAYPQPLGSNNLNVFAFGGTDTLTSGTNSVAARRRARAMTSLNGGAGERLPEPGQGDDTIAGAGGIDTVTYFGTTTRSCSVDLGVTVAAGHPRGGLDTITDTENLQGSRLRRRADRRTTATTASSTTATSPPSSATTSSTGGCGSDNLSSGNGDDTPRRRAGQRLPHRQRQRHRHRQLRGGLHGPGHGRPRLPCGPAHRRRRHRHLPELVREPDGEPVRGRSPRPATLSRTSSTSGTGSATPSPASLPQRRRRRTASAPTRPRSTPSTRIARRWTSWPRSRRIGAPVTPVTPITPWAQADRRQRPSARSPRRRRAKGKKKKKCKRKKKGSARPRLRPWRTARSPSSRASSTASSTPAACGPTSPKPARARRS